jgi:hypothetical protein
LPDEDSRILPEDGIEIAIVPEAGYGMIWENPSGCAASIAAMKAE